MSGKLALVFLAACVCTAYAGYLGAPALGVGYAAPALGYAAPAVSYAAPAVSYAAPAVSYAAPVAAVAAPVLIDNTHYSYGYHGPYGNGFVSAARSGPFAAHSYKFHA